MNKEVLEKTAVALVAEGKGILAADESDKTIAKRFATINLESTSENHRIYRQLLFKTPGIEEFISGIILFDETIRQETDEGIPFPSYISQRGIIPGIKVDKGVVDLANFPGEKITEGLDGLRERLIEYKNLGARFTKWRAVITIGEGIPTDCCINANAELIARFAALSQEADLVPIVEPEVLMDGKHDLERSEKETYRTLKGVFLKLSEYRVYFPGMLLKTNWAHPGKESGILADSQKIAEATLRVFKEVLPQELPGVVFLSGGDSPEESSDHLNALNLLDNVPWELSFSFGRALQEPVLKVWQGKPENVSAAQEEFYKRAKLNSLAREGKYNREMEGVER